MNKNNITFENIKTSVVNKKQSFIMDSSMLEYYTTIHPKYLNIPLIPIPKTEIDKILVAKLIEQMNK